MEYFASEILQIRIDEMSCKIGEYEQAKNAGVKAPISKKTYTGYLRTLPFLEALELQAFDNDAMIKVSLNDNLGVITEATVKALLGKGNSKSQAGSTDLITGGKRFEIKLLIKGSSSYPSSLDFTTDEDVLIISNLGAFILRNKDIKTAKEQGYFKKNEAKLKPTILGKSLLETTSFTERLTTEWGLNTW